MTKSKGTAKSSSGPRANGPRWPLAVAKSRLSEIIRLAREEGPQIITSHGRYAAEVSISARVTDAKTDPAPEGTPAATLGELFRRSARWRDRIDGIDLPERSPVTTRDFSFD